MSRQCAHRWVARYAAEGEPGLLDRSSQPQHGRPASPAAEAAVLAARRQYRRGSDRWPPSSGCRRGRCRGSCAGTSRPPWLAAIR